MMMAGEQSIDRRRSVAARAARNRCPNRSGGGSLEELRPFFNVDDHGWILIRAFLVAALRPGLPLTILVARGEQGARESTACRVISSLIDPRTSALGGVLREVVISLHPPEIPSSCVSITWTAYPRISPMLGLTVKPVETKFEDKRIAMRIKVEFTKPPAGAWRATGL
jgi:hypothetical protein